MRGVGDFRKKAKGSEEMLYTFQDENRGFNPVLSGEWLAKVNGV